ncbi:hypothetical protein ACQEU5_18550 [Marinactinospora thermotolerans]|nr:hypothetical protein [Marinactinospora thermotolerans]
MCSWEVVVGDETYTITEEPPLSRLGMVITLLLWGASSMTLGLRRKREAQ